MPKESRPRSRSLSAQNIAIGVLIIIGLATNYAIYHQHEAAEEEATREHFNRLSQTFMREFLKNPPDPSSLSSQLTSPDTP